MTKKKAAAKRPNPNDATLRNVRAAVRRLAALQTVVTQMLTDLDTLTVRVDQLDGGSETPGSNPVPGP